MRREASTLALTALLVLLTALTACGDESAGSGGTAAPGGGGGGGQGGANGFTQAGAQDFGLFRKILDDGGIPAPEALDPIGFFAEHKLDYPAPSCGGDVCLHGLLGVTTDMITGSNFSMLQLGLNTPLEASELVRPPLHVVLAVDVSGSMTGEPLDSLVSGLLRMLDALEDDDTVTLVTYSDKAKVVFEAQAMSEKAAMAEAVNGLHASGATNLYDGLFTALELANTHFAREKQNRVIVLSDGVPTVGLESPAKMKALAEGYAKMGIGISTIGVGAEFDPTIMRDLAEVGSGTFYFLDDPLAVKEVFTEEVATFLVPAALDVHIDVSLAAGYLLRGAYGTNGWSGGPTGGAVEIPALFLAGRKSSEDPVEGGRRGGGGGILLELVPKSEVDKVDDPLTVAVVALAYTDPTTGDRMSQELTIENPHEPGVTPDGGYFSEKTVEKAFVMLNVLIGFQTAAELAADADTGGALAVLKALRPELQAWIDDHPDPDIADDLVYVDKFIANLAALMGATGNTGGALVR
jgi:Ca-activated chloride channel family protein